jgi:hypothetical protein
LYILRYQCPDDADRSYIGVIELATSITDVSKSEQRQAPD